MLNNLKCEYERSGLAKYRGMVKIEDNNHVVEIFKMISKDKTSLIVNITSLDNDGFSKQIKDIVKREFNEFKLIPTREKRVMIF